MQQRVLIPQPPFDSAIDPAVQLVVTSFMAIAAGLALLYALRHWARSGKPTFLLLYLSGGAMMLLEPMVDTVGACWFPEINSWIAFRAWGRTLPVWLCLCYFFYFGIGVGVTWQLMRHGLSRRQLWGLFVAGMLGDFVMEATLLHFDTWVYYGAQPLLLLKFPMWWAPVNSLITMATAALVCRFEATLQQGWRQLQIIPLALSVSAAVNALAGWPSWLVINTELGWVTTQIGGLASFAISIWFMAMIVSVLAVDVHRPLAMKAKAGMSLAA